MQVTHRVACQSGHWATARYQVAQQPADVLYRHVAKPSGTLPSQTAVECLINWACRHPCTDLDLSPAPRNYDQLRHIGRPPRAHLLQRRGVEEAHAPQQARQRVGCAEQERGTGRGSDEASRKQAGRQIEKALAKIA